MIFNWKRLTLIFGVSLLLSLTTALPSYSFVPTSPHLILGNPSGAITSLNSPDNYLMVKAQYTLSYNQSKSIPNWVSWQLNDSWLGKVKRCKGDNKQDAFAMDQSLPIALSPVLPSDYRGSGFDRGHLIPSADRTDNRENNCATFLMTNIIPQSRDLNRGAWESLESYSRKLARSGKELYIIAGGVRSGGEDSQGKTILSLTGHDSGLNITVPAICWKIILVLDRPGLGLAGITPNTRVIAVAMRQKRVSPNAKWYTKETRGSFRYITSVNEIERLTGYDFLSNLPKSLQANLEAKVDAGEI